MSALHMVMRKDRAAHDGKVGVGAEEIMGKQLDEIQELNKGGAIDLHGRVLTRKRDTVLVIIYIGRILQIPLRPRHGHGNLTKGLSCGLRRVTRISLVVVAKQALGIAALRQKLCSGNGLGILLGLGQIDGNIDIAVLRGRFPLEVTADTVAANVVAVARQLIKVVGRLLGRNGIERIKLADNLGGSGRDLPHDRGVEKVAIHHAVLTKSVCHGIVTQSAQNVLQRRDRFVRFGGVIGQLQHLKHPIGGVNTVARLDHALFLRIADQIFHIVANIHTDPSQSVILSLLL